MTVVPKPQVHTDPSVDVTGRIPAAYAWWGIVVSCSVLVVELLLARRVKPKRLEKTDPTKAGHRHGSCHQDITATRVSGDEGISECVRISPSSSTSPVTSGARTLPFAVFQRRYLCVYLLCACADWMKGPYTIALYDEYGLTMSQIATLFVAGFLSSLVFGTVAGAIGDSVGRLRMAQQFCVLFIASMLTKLSSRVWVLALGRVLGGVATSLLSTTFESWMVTAHHSMNYDAALISDTFAKASFLNSLLAIIAGLVAQVSVQCWGNVAPFLVPVPLLLAALWLMRDWTENFGEANVSVAQSFVRGLAAIHDSIPLQLLGACEALFEACMFIWVFVWTPSLDPSNTSPFGLIFAAFMLCMMIGSVSARLHTVEGLLPWTHVVAVAGALVATMWFSNKLVVFAAFSLSEVAVGMYNVCHPSVRARLIRNDTRSAVLSLFRVPMNGMVFVVLKCGLTAHQTLWALVVLQCASAWFLWLLKRHL